jgi:hypothetical protein
MSRYVDKPHGLTIGSDNWFFVIDRAHPERPGEIRDWYKAIVSFRGYTFDRVSSANYFILTPAQQLVWRKNVRREMQKLGNLEYPIDKQFWTISEWIVRWLNDNVGALHDKWDCYTEAEQSSRNIFFKRRTDALAFCKFIDTILVGAKIGEF